MNLLPAPLVLLIAMRLRAAGRGILRSLRTPKGIFVGLLMAFGFAVMLVPAAIAAFMPRPAPTPAMLAIQARTIALMPFAILGFVLLAMVRASGDTALAFLQAEVDFLFPAPFTRRQLLFYKLAQRVIPLLFVSLFFSLWVRNLAQSWLASWIGVLLSLWFVHLASLCLALTGQMLGTKRFARWRWTLIIGTVVAVALGTTWVGRALEGAGPLEMLAAFANTSAGRIIAAPTAPFADVITAKHMTEALGSAVAALAINIALLILAVRLDANWLEAGAESSRKLADRIEEMRKTGGFGGSGGKAFVALRIPMLPRVGGIGPLAWRQCVTGVRQGARGLLLVVVLIGVLVIPQLLTTSGAHWSVALRPLGPIALSYMSLFLPQVLRLDFRADVDRMDLLKGLPVAPIAVTLAQVLVPATLITALQAPLAIAFDQVLGWEIPLLPIWIPALFLGNLLNASLENAAFLTWPVRPSRGVGVQFAMSQMIAQLVKMFLLVLLLGAAAASGAGCFYLAGNSFVAAAAGGTTVLLVEVAIVIAIMTRLFVRFDPSLEQVADA